MPKINRTKTILVSHAPSRNEMYQLRTALENLRDYREEGGEGAAYYACINLLATFSGDVHIVYTQEVEVEEDDIEYL